jgi:hypothetical protein
MFFVGPTKGGARPTGPTETYTPSRSKPAPMLNVGPVGRVGAFWYPLAHHTTFARTFAAPTHRNYLYFRAWHFSRQNSGALTALLSVGMLRPAQATRSAGKLSIWCRAKCNRTMTIGTVSDYIRTMRTIITIGFALLLGHICAQEPSLSKYELPEPPATTLRPHTMEPPPEWYIYKAGDNYNTGTWAALAGAMLGTGLLFSDSEGQRIAGGITLGVGLGVGIGFHIAGNGKLMRGGWLLQQRATP